LDRYHRQSLIPQVGLAGQTKLSAARVLVLGMGALGCTIADQLARAGVDTLRIVDRDIVEWTNLQRQTLYSEEDAIRSVPKVEGAQTRLNAIREDLLVEPHAIDIDASNIESLTRDIDLILDGSDNAELRYLINDVSVKHRIPWVMGGCIGVEGRVAAFDPKSGGPCLRCVFPTPPAAGELATCDTAGALGPAIGAVASLQVVEAMKLIVGDATAATRRLHTLDVWAGRQHSVDLGEAKRADCPCCGARRFEFLDRPATGGAKLCGRNAVQVRPAAPTRVDLIALAKRLGPVATVDVTSLMLKVELRERPEYWLSVFGDGRAIVFGTADLALARSIYARVIGT
jgi:adenylyltransferase/sulfurtransferase